MTVPQNAEHALEIAAKELHGTITRTKTSVVGHRSNETIIFATTARGWTVTAMLTGIKIEFIAELKGLFKKCLKVEGLPMDLVNEILDEPHRERIAALNPLSVQLMQNGIRLEHKYGIDDLVISRAMDLVASLAGRAKFAQQMMTSPKRQWRVAER